MAAPGAGPSGRCSVNSRSISTVSNEDGGGRGAGVAGWAGPAAGGADDLGAGAVGWPGPAA